MTPPRVCPRPPDCPLYDQRVYSPDEALRRAILMERRSHIDLAALVRAEALRVRRPVAALPPASEPVPLPISSHLKGVQR
jgi:hypothetical protein